jgi:hypothetical protein
MGRADELRLGDWNARCDRCGAKRKGSELRLTWDNLYVCPEHWEPRQPQDFVRSILENPNPPFVRNPLDTFIGLCGPAPRTSIASVAVAECWVAELIDPAYDPYTF